MEISLHQRINVLKAVVLIIILVIYYNKKSPNQHIRMISEGSCGTESWSNNAEISALPSQ